MRCFSLIPTCQLDTSSFFLDESYGADNDAAAIVTQLAVAHALGKIKNVRRRVCVFVWFVEWAHTGGAQVHYN